MSAAWTKNESDQVIVGVTLTMTTDAIAALLRRPRDEVAAEIARLRKAGKLPPLRPPAKRRLA